MAFKISGAAIRNPIPSLVLFAVLMLLGTVAFQALPITRAPNIDIPVIQVMVTQSGAAPGDLELQVTKRIEDAVASVSGVKHIQSSVTDGVSSTGIEFRLEVSTDRALNDVRDAVAKIRALLPHTIDEPIIQRIDVVGQSIQTYAATAPGMTLEGLSWYVDNTVIRALQGVPGVGRVDRIGGVTREIQIALQPDRLAAMGITAGDVNKQLLATSVDLAGGRGEFGAKEQSIRTLAGATTLDGLAATPIVLPGGRQMRLADLATITDAAQEPRGFARLNGDTPVVSFAIFRAKGASDVTVAEAVAVALAKVSAANPDVRFVLIDDSVRTTKGAYTSAMHSLIEGAILATIVVFLFLRDWRATLIAAVALPLSVIPAFGAMQLMGFSLNFVSLLAITLVTGILVDDAIVEIENIVRHIRMGKRPYAAAMEAADEIGLAVIAITFTIVAVFAPVSFMGGIPGQYFKQFGLTVAAAVLVSLLVARLVTPVMAAYFLTPMKNVDHGDNAPTRLYVRLLTATLNHRTRTLIAGFVLFALSIASTTLLPTGFIPPQDNSRIVVSLELPPGSTLDDVAVKTDIVARTVKKIPEVNTVLITGGSTPTGLKEVRRASAVINLSRKQDRGRSQKAIEAEVTALISQIPDVRGWYVNDRGERELSVNVLGDDAVALDATVARLEGEMRRLEGFSNVAPSAGIDRPEIIVTPRAEEAARLGISTETISQAVRIATLGDVDANLAKFRAGDRLVPIRVQADLGLRRDIQALQAMPIPAAGGISVPLSAVANISLAQGPSSIERYDRVRRVVLGADLTGGIALGEALQRVFALPGATNVPAGVIVKRSGDAEIMAEVFSGFALAMGVGLVLVLALLVLLLRGVFQPLTILLSLPLSLGGVILALLIFHQPISLPVAIGILMLMGIVTKNAIMLVDFAVEAQAAGVPRREAVLSAGRNRARPIVMTTVAMIAGMIPSAMGLGDGGEFRAPMAIGVIGGLIVSTVLSLVFVPSLYTLMDDLSRWTASAGRRLLTPREADGGKQKPGMSGQPAE